MIVGIITTVLGFAWAAIKLPFTLFTVLFFAIAELLEFSVKVYALVKSNGLVMITSAFAMIVKALTFGK